MLQNMTEETAPIYYISPTNKIHGQQCRHYKADTNGWYKMDSYSDALATGLNLLPLKSSAIALQNI